MFLGRAAPEVPFRPDTLTSTTAARATTEYTALAPRLHLLPRPPQWKHTSTRAARTTAYSTTPTSDAKQQPSTAPPTETTTHMLISQRPALQLRLPTWKHTSTTATRTTTEQAAPAPRPHLLPRLPQWKHTSTRAAKTTAYPTTPTSDAEQ